MNLKKLIIGIMIIQKILKFHNSNENFINKHIERNFRIEKETK